MNKFKVNDSRFPCFGLAREEAKRLVYQGYDAFSTVYKRVGGRWVAIYVYARDPNTGVISQA